MNPAWKLVPLREVLNESTNTEQPIAGKLYKQVGVRLWGQGIYEREVIDGLNTAYKSFSCVQSGDLVMNKIWARNGAVGVVPPKLANCYVSTEFPVYSVDANMILPTWMDLITQQEFFWNECAEKAFGTSGKNRIKPQKFLQITIPLPPLEEQQRIVARLSAAREKIERVRLLREEQAAGIRNALYSAYCDATEGAPTLPMSKIAPITRRAVAIAESEQYAELGIRCFGKGTFHKPALPGIDVGTKKLFRICAGDVMFSNVFAWEGAIAVAKSDDDGRVGSHRFISCVCKPDVALPEFLCFHFLTEKGLEAINAASPGGAGRNKTLGLDKLERILVPVPSLSKQKHFVSLLSKLTALQAHHAATARELDALFPCLLEKAFRGELS